MDITVVTLKKTIAQRGYGVIETTPRIDEAAEAYENLVEDIIRAAEVETTMRRLIEEIAQLEPDLARIEEDVRVLLLPRDPNDDRNILLEIRAGTGGDEAALFTADVFRMYTRYAETQGWRVEIMSSNHTGIGGLKEVIALIERKGAKLGLLTTSGFRDLLEIGRQKRPDLYDLQADKPLTLVSRDLRLEVPERVRHDGSVEIPQSAFIAALKMGDEK